LPTTTITLTVHPWFGESVSVVRGHGEAAVWVEREDGDLRIIPACWTALVPRAHLVEADGNGRLCAEAALALSKWVLARKTRS
jgi:hypothetical protein